MEVVGVIGAGVALVQLSEYGIRFARTIYRLAEDVDTITKELNHFAKQVESFATEIGAAHLSLENHFKQMSNSTLTNYISSHGIMGMLAERSRFVRHGLREAKDNIRKMGNGWFTKLLAIMNWMRKKSAIAQLMANMEAVKSSTILLMITAQLEATTTQISKAQGSAEVERLRARM